MTIVNSLDYWTFSTVVKTAFTYWNGQYQSVQLANSGQENCMQPKILAHFSITLCVTVNFNSKQLILIDIQFYHQLRKVSTEYFDHS